MKRLHSWLIGFRNERDSFRFLGRTYALISGVLVLASLLPGIDTRLSNALFKLSACFFGLIILNALALAIGATIFGNKHVLQSSHANNHKTGSSPAEDMELLDEYGKLITEVMSHVQDRYPALAFPESLLPAPKAELERMFQVLKSHMTQEGRNILNSNEATLRFFVPDAVARDRNGAFLNDPSYREVLASRRKPTKQ